MQLAPVVDNRRPLSLSLLTLHSPDGASHQCARELSRMTRSLAQIQRRFLIHFAGTKSFDGVQSSLLPSNVELLDPGAFTSDGFWYRGRKLSSWWDLASSQDVPKRRELTPTEGAVIRVLNLVRSNADVDLICYAVKQDPGLLHGLLRYINTVKIAFDNSSGGFRSFEQAIVFMGYRRFSKWLSMYLLHASVEGNVPILYLASIVRARMMEALGKPAGFPHKQQDMIFVTGIFSLLDEITGVPMEVILQSLELDNTVKEALLEQKGAYAPLLQLTCASETGTAEHLSRQIAEVGVSVQDTNLALLSAIQFATDFD